VGIWDERKLAKSLRITLKELMYLQKEVQQLSDRLCAVEGDGERADVQRERGESWGEVGESITTALEELDSTLEAVETLLVQ